MKSVPRTLLNFVSDSLNTKITQAISKRVKITEFQTLNCLFPAKGLLEIRNTKVKNYNCSARLTATVEEPKVTS